MELFAKSNHFFKYFDVIVLGDNSAGSVGIKMEGETLLGTQCTEVCYTVITVANRKGA